MWLYFLFLLFLGAFADEVSILDHLIASEILQHADCPPLFHGQNCQIPYCFPEHGNLVKRGLDDYYCNCTSSYASGEHCESVNCNDGNLSNSTFKCECPKFVGGSYCELTILSLIVCVLIVLGTVLCCTILVIIAEKIKKKRARYCAARNRTNESHPPPAPTVPLVERDVIQEQ
uniref:EGF-like domain-containing protein n=1 Tax=Panagrellus redivivus TaxID=6233 RepID=A0A7E4VB37_PANRE